MPAEKTTGDAPGKKTTKVSPARAAAFHILLELSRSTSAHSDDLLRSDRVNGLSPLDRNLCTAITMGVLRWQIFLDERLYQLLTHKSKLDEPVHIALRMAAFQLLFSDRVPAHAAISDSVELTKRSGHRYASGLVNAVLRRFTIDSGGEKRLPDATCAHPEWLVRRWQSSLGSENAALICAYNQQPPPTHLRLLTPEAEASLRAEGVVLEPGAFLAASRRVITGDAVNSRAVLNGVARIQDEGSQLIAELLQAPPSSRILDCCAAPGGKAAILAERHPSGKVVAGDISAARVARMRELFNKTPLLARIESRMHDATQSDNLGFFDAILCDVPCSGTGTLARNPEIKLRLQAHDLLRQQERQLSIVKASLQALAPGGQLLYSTCSLEPEEDEAVIKIILADDSTLSVVPVQQRIEALALAGVIHAEGAGLLLAKCLLGPFLRTFPGIVPVDGFFAALLTRGRV